MKNVTIIGATGFGGLGLIEILLRHPEFNIKQLVARKDTGIPVSDVFPHLKGYCDIIVDSPEKTDYDTDLVFFSTPDRAGMTIINDFHKRSIPVIDFSGDFRFNNTADYGIYARNKGMEDTHLAPDILKETVYGLPEKFRDEIRNATVVGNPGCFAINMILALLPAAEEGIIVSDTIICDGKTGVSGAGKNSGEANLYPQRHENVNTYREGKHQHLVEVENIINLNGKSEKKILFVPQIVPLNRGILVTIYADIREGYTTDKVQKLYRDYYHNEPFILITDRSPNTADVRGSNRCEIRTMVDKRTGKLLITAVIDNLIKGQSGNAVQNANLIMGFEETLGINNPAFYP
ncbi:MAG: N-acetyl-gamma-glutamyl-phosphate reductase [Spirochaetae bacterium HGW-Spirochaetae-1]|jgi:N-acetyl-gamma-glutamyl-phosphate reductase|nr:MAG: N-acetyl-gamma-glutamyl-phosphate reductase [Spirochaetae bacterium HGW-Spirochaetae-1]